MTELPMKPSQQTTIEQALDLTRQMLDLAKQGEWGRVTNIEAIRQKSIMNSFDKSSTTTRNSALGIQIQEIMGLDVQIQALVNDARSSIRDELVKMNRVKSQTLTYQAR